MKTRWKVAIGVAAAGLIGGLYVRHEWVEFNRAYVEHEEAAMQSVPVPFVPQCSDAACKAWAEFRRSYPYPYQGMAVRHDAKGTYLVISEPPPDVSKPELRASVEAVFQNDLVDYREHRWMIGEDGWLEDVVLTLKPSSPGTLEGRALLVQNVLHGMPDGIALLDIDQPMTKAERLTAPNLHVRPDELHAWLTDSSLKWSSISSPDRQVDFAGITDASSVANTYVSADGTLVAFSFPISQVVAGAIEPELLEQFRKPFQLFAARSDVVLGAVWSKGGQAAIVARHRLQPYSSAPPLRFETFALLARERSNELQQSYERTKVGAGKLFDGSHKYRDWAPIYLSESLVNSEFGALLNITDQILKSWSEAGGVNYLYFDYPMKPSKFAFGGQPLAKIVAEKSKDDNISVLFNWNTAGSAVTTETQDLTMLTAGRTGSLPVTYGADVSSSGKGMQTGGDLFKYEEEAYDYFSSLGDPNLARVVSYTLIYQALRAMTSRESQPGALTQTRKTPRARARAEAGLTQDVETLLDRLAADNLEPHAFVSQEEFDAAVEHGKQELQTSLEQLGDLAPDHARIAQLLVSPGDEHATLVENLLKSAPDRNVEAYVAQLTDRATAHEARVNAYNKRISALRSSPGGLRTGDARSDLIQSIVKEREAIEAEERIMSRDFAPFLALQQFNEGMTQINGELAPAIYNVSQVTWDLDSVHRRYLAANVVPPKGWIKTPSVVLSWGAEILSSIGGHNLTASTMRIEVTDSVKSVDLIDSPTGKVLRVNPKYQQEASANADRIARDVEHRKVTSIQDLQRTMALPAKQRSRAEALKMADRRVTSAAQAADVATTRRLTTLLESDGADAAIARDAQGYKIAAERNPTPPPVLVCCKRFRDTQSLVGFIEGARRSTGGSGRIVFLDEPLGHIEALAASLASNPPPSMLARIARRLGMRDTNEGFDILYTGGAREPVSVRAVPTLDSGAFARELAEPRNWKAVSRTQMPDDRANAVVGSYAWSGRGSAAGTADSRWLPARDGVPVVIEMRFQGASASSEVRTVRLVAGFKLQRVDQGKKALRDVVDDLLDAPESSKLSIGEAYGHVKRLLDSKSNEVEYERLNMIVEEDRLQFYMTKREGEWGNPAPAS